MEIKTKYNIGDTLYFLGYNLEDDSRMKVMSMTVNRIEITATEEDGMRISYIGTDYSCEIECRLFESREALIASL